VNRRKEMIKLVLTKSEKMETSFVAEVKSSRGNIVAVLGTRPYSSFKPLMKATCTKRSCFFIDTLMDQEGDNLVYVNPENLTGLSIAINQAQQAIGGKVTIIFDSVNNLALRNNLGTLSKFFAFILNKSADWNAEITILGSESPKVSEILDLIKQRADKVVKK
jgi:hypothetical protein